MNVNDIKEIIIKEDLRWSEYQPSNYYYDELTFGENFIHNVRKIYENYDESTFEWRFETQQDLYNYKKDFLNICEKVLKLEESKFHRTCSYCYYIIINFKDGSTKDYSYFDDMTSSNMSELKDAIIKALPANCDIYPSCIK